jgi:hypothetical protein
MKKLPLFSLLAMLVYLLSSQTKANDAINKKSWRSLFNGQNLADWSHVGDGRFVIEDGLLKTEGGMGLLWYTREKFGNCVIRVVYKVTYPSSNSGVFVRIAHPPKDEWDAVHHGYEIQIYDPHDEYNRTGAIYTIAPATTLAAKPAGEWNMMEITLKGQHITVVLNGVKVSDYDPTKQSAPARKKWSEPKRGPRPDFGYIGVQNHDHDAKQNDSHVYFKEISVHPL